MPTPWLQIEACIRPRMFEASPKDIKEWVSLRARSGRVDPSHVLLFYLTKFFAPGGAAEKVFLINSILNPNACSQPQSAQVELLEVEGQSAKVRRARMQSS